MVSRLYSTIELAEKLDTDPMVLRRFLRSTDDYESPGKGGRYYIPARSFKSLKSQYKRWEREHTRVGAR